MTREFGRMPWYRRLRTPGATYFFAVNLARWGSTTLVDHIDALREAYAPTKVERPVLIPCFACANSLCFVPLKQSRC